MLDEMVMLPGTVRARPPEDMWHAVAGQLPRLGITRVARLTDLDCIGLPVWTAIRPASLTLTTSQGKGATDLLARLSAVMEAIELWHVEQPLPITARGPARDVDPACPVAALPMTVPHSESALVRTVWDWTEGTGLVHGGYRLLPADLVRRRVQRPAWTPDLLRATSTGLACGATREEALLHALYEVVERDVLARDERAAGQRRTLIDPATVDDPFGREVLDRLDAAGMCVELALVDGPYLMPVCIAYLWSEDYPVIFAGGGCHAHPGIALTRAVTEAAQSRLTAIAGTRDDLPADFGSADLPALPPRTREGFTSWRQATAHYPGPAATLPEQLAAVARLVQAVAGHEPVALDLSGPVDQVHAVQVVCPGTRSRVRRAMPR